MGRVGRYKKIKKIDPFYVEKNRTASGNVSEKRPRTKPKKKKYSRAELEEYGRKLTAEAPVPSGDRGFQRPKLTKKAGESLREFNLRVDREYASHVAKTARAITKTASKKREYKRRKKQEKRARAEQRLEEDRPDVEPDQVEFGEVVEAPPQLAVKPWRSTKGKASKRQGLLLEAMLDGAGKGSVAPARAQALVEERERAIEAYRSIKRSKYGEFAL